MEKRHLEIIGTNSINCPRLNSDRSEGDNVLQALVRTFKDGTTNVLCTELIGSDCKVTKDHCAFLVEEPVATIPVVDQPGVGSSWFPEKTGLPPCPSLEEFMAIVGSNEDGYRGSYPKRIELMRVLWEKGIISTEETNEILNAHGDKERHALRSWIPFVNKRFARIGYANRFLFSGGLRISHGSERCPTKEIFLSIVKPNTRSKRSVKKRQQILTMMWDQGIMSPEKMKEILGDFDEKEIGLFRSWVNGVINKKFGEKGYSDRFNFGGTLRMVVM